VFILIPQNYSRKAIVLTDAISAQLQKLAAVKVRGQNAFAGHTMRQMVARWNDFDAGLFLVVGAGPNKNLHPWGEEEENDMETSHGHGSHIWGAVHFRP